MPDVKSAIKRLEELQGLNRIAVNIPTVFVEQLLQLLKEHIKIKEQLEELQIMENSKIKECDSYCDWDAKNYHQGRFDAYSIALAGFNQKN